MTVESKLKSCHLALAISHPHGYGSWQGVFSVPCPFAGNSSRFLSWLVTMPRLERLCLSILAAASRYQTESLSFRQVLRVSLCLHKLELSESLQSTRVKYPCRSSSSGWKIQEWSWNKVSHADSVKPMQRLEGLVFHHSHICPYSFQECGKPSHRREWTPACVDTWSSHQPLREQRTSAHQPLWCHFA